MILSTIAELEDEPVAKLDEKKQKQDIPIQTKKLEEKSEILTDEKIFLENVKAKTLVLFEGLQSPKNENLDVRLDITLNYLEFLLSNIEQRLQQIK